MGTILLWILAALAAAGSVAAAAMLYRRGGCKREERLRDWAEQLGLKFSAEIDTVPRKPYEAFAVFSFDGAQQRLVLIEGEHEFSISGHAHRCEILMGDIECHDDDQSDLAMPWWFQLMTESSTRRFSYLLVRLPVDDVPAMRIRHRHGPGGSGVFPGREPLQFEWDRFNREVQVTCDDKRFGSNLIWKRMMEFLIEHPAWPIAIESGWISMTDFNSHWTPTEYRASLEWMEDFLAMWPEHLVVTMMRENAV